MPNLHSVCNVVIMLQTVVTFLGREKCWVLTSGRQCFCRQANFSSIQSCYHLISPQTCQCCVNITCNSDVKWRSTLKYVYVLGQWMGVRLTYIIFCNSVFHVKIFQILSLDLFSPIVFFLCSKRICAKTCFTLNFVQTCSLDVLKLPIQNFSYLF